MRIINLGFMIRLKTLVLVGVHKKYDRTLLWLTMILVGIGFVMVLSTSMPISVRLSENPFYFVKRYVCCLCLALLMSLVTLRIPMSIWQQGSSLMLLMTLIMLLLVLIFGHSVNGAARWIVLGTLRIQPAELSKLASCCYLASYLVRQAEEVRTHFWSFCKPIGVMLLLAILLLAQPDLGTVLVLFITTMAMLFLAEAKIWHFLPIISAGILVVMCLIIVEPYRMQRVTSFWNPWNDPFGKGYQLTQSLMAFGRGQWLGQGLGNSIQKFEYLTEAHTDFIFSIVGEELGYFGVLLVLLMVFLVASRAIAIGRKALEIDQKFSGFLACSIGIWFSLQTMVNVGATAGMLPIKGLTLPLISYGGSSMLSMLTAIVLLLRTAFETSLAKAQAFIR